MPEHKLKDTARLSHAYIISAQSPELGLRTAREYAAAAVCTDPGKKPCGLCRDCRKVGTGIHPDVISVRRAADDRGKLKKEISVGQIRQMTVESYVLPNEADRKVFIIEEAELMNLSAQNAALKLLEEPPAGVMFLLCTSNPDQLLPTVRSRCVELICAGGEKAEDAEALKLAQAYLTAVASCDPAEVFALCAGADGMDGSAAAAFVDCAFQLAADMLCGRRDALGMSRERLLYLTQLLSRCSGYLRVNTGVKHILGLLAVDSIADSGNRG